jgi:hypothetical protein
MATRTITFGDEVGFDVPAMPGGGPSRRPRGPRRPTVVVAPGEARQQAGRDAALLPPDVKHMRGDTYMVIAGDRAIIVAEGKVILRRSGKSRQWARYLVGKVAGALRTAIEVFLGYPTAEEIRAWLERLPGGAAVRAALLAWFEKLVDEIAPARLFAAVGLLAGLGRPALPGPMGV